MNLSFPALKTFAARLSVGVVMACGLEGRAQDALEFQELQNNLRTAYAKIQALENAAQSHESPTAALLESAAKANAEAADLKERYIQLRGLLDALGISAIDNGGDEKAERLISALNDLRLIKAEQKSLAGQLSNLLQSTVAFSEVATPGNPESVRNLTEAIEAAQSALRTTSLVSGEGAANKELSAATVISLKPELGVVVLDVGSRDGAKPGMPFNLYREDKPVAKVLVTEVRQSLSGAVIRELFSPSDKPMVGDRGQADASSSF
jgi:hypothetical protein